MWLATTIAIFRNIYSNELEMDSLQLLETKIVITCPINNKSLLIYLPVSHVHMPRMYRADAKIEKFVLNFPPFSEKSV